MSAALQPLILHPLSAPPTREDALACHRLFLGREPEGEAELAPFLEGCATLDELRQRFLRTEEFRRKAPPLLPSLPLAPDPLEIETEATPEQLSAMLARTATYWARIGEEAPHWSVLTQDRFRPETIKQHRAAFFNSAENDRRLVAGMLARHRVDPASIEHCLEFGCGVGRATLVLAGMFAKVTGCDVSPAHLKLARREAEARGIANITWFRSQVERPMPGGRWGLWFSRMVLQHNPPPVMAHLLRIAFRGLAPGGLAIFQVPTHCTGYAFSIARYLGRSAAEAPDMEMHALPQPALFALAAQAKLEVLEVREDTVLSDRLRWLSNTFVLRRPAPRP